VTERIVIVVSENGTEQVIKKLKGVGAQAKSSGDSVGFLQNALGLLGAAATIKGVLGYIDAFTELQNKLATVSRSQEEAALASQKLLDVANRSRTSWEDTVTLYQRVVRSTEQLGLSHKESARIVETLNKATIVGGASAIEASNAIIQLSQAFSAGVLRGQELRSVMTQMPLIADILAKKMNTTMGGLLKLGPQGKISAQVMADALLEASDEIDKAFAKTLPTIGQQMKVLGNQVLKFVGDLNNKYEILPKITKGIEFLGANIDTFARAVLAGSLVIGIQKAIGGFNALTAAIAANPVGLIAVAITAGLVALIAFSDQLSLAGEGTATLADFAKAFWEELKSDIAFAVELFQKNFGWIADYLRQIFGTDFAISIKGFLMLGAKAVDSFIGIWVGAGFAIIEAFRNIPATVELIFKGMINALIGQIESFINTFVSAINVIADSSLGKKLGLTALKQNVLPRLEMSKEAQTTGAAIGKAFVDGFKSVTDAQDLVTKLSIRAEEIGKDRLAKAGPDPALNPKAQEEFEAKQAAAAAALTRAQSIADVIESLENENEALTKVIDNRRISNEYIRIEQGLRSKGVTLTEAESQSIQSVLEKNRALKDQQSAYQSIMGPQEEAARRMTALSELYRAGKIDVDQYTVALREAQIQQLSTSRDAMSGFKSGFLQVQDELSNFAELSSKTVVNAFHNMEDSMVDFVKTGKFNFSGLIDSILDDMIRLVTRQAMSGLFSSLGGMGGGLGSMFAGLAGARAAGGPVSPGGAYLVGERGPEVFTPNTGGAISPNGSMGGAPPQVNVNVVNVSDPDEVSSALNHPANQDLIVNILRKNKGAARQALGV
jgi:lambda family phage tail tape measure protein